MNKEQVKKCMFNSLWCFHTCSLLLSLPTGLGKICKSPSKVFDGLNKQPEMIWVEEFGRWQKYVKIWERSESGFDNQRSWVWKKWILYVFNKLVQTWSNQPSCIVVHLFTVAVHWEKATANQKAAEWAKIRPGLNQPWHPAPDHPCGKHPSRAAKPPSSWPVRPSLSCLLFTVAPGSLGWKKGLAGAFRLSLFSEPGKSPGGLP